MRAKNWGPAPIRAPFFPAAASQRDGRRGPGRQGGRGKPAPPAGPPPSDWTSLCLGPSKAPTRRRACLSARRCPSPKSTVNTTRRRWRADASAMAERGMAAAGAPALPCPALPARVRCEIEGGRAVRVRTLVVLHMYRVPHAGVRRHRRPMDAGRASTLRVCRADRARRGDRPGALSHAHAAAAAAAGRASAGASAGASARGPWCGGFDDGAARRRKRRGGLAGLPHHDPTPRASSASGRTEKRTSRRGDRQMSPGFFC